MKFIFTSNLACSNSVNSKILTTKNTVEIKPAPLASQPVTHHGGQQIQYLVHIIQCLY